MKVLYDSRAFLEPVGGVSRYFVELIKHLPLGVQWDIAAAATNNRYLQAAPFNVPEAEYSFRHFLPGVCFRGKSIVYSALSRLGMFRSMELLNARCFSEALKRDDFDVLHLTGPHGCGNEWIKYGGKAKIVITIHDLIPDKMWSGPVGARVRRQRKRDLSMSDAIIAVSEYTKQDLMELYGVEEKKITVVHHGCDIKESVCEEGAHDSVMDGRFVLYVGKRGGYKNSDFFLRNMAPLLRDDPDLKIVMTDKPLDETEMQLCKKCGIYDSVEARMFDDSELRSLYAHAECFVYPSKYEGFGIPVLEAFAAGCPAVLARSTCFPEVGGDAALYFNPDDGEEMRSAIREAMGVKRTELKRRGRERVKLFSWEKCAHETVAVYSAI